MSALVFGRYEILGPLGGRGSTRAYKAKSIGVEGFEKEVVVWRIRGEANSGSTSHEQMIAEAKRAALLSHANIAQVLDVGVESGDCFVATEYVAGGSLASLLAQRPLPWRIIAHIAVQVANALDYAHARRDASQRLLGIVHRGVSPHRILLSTAGGVKLTGFGTTWPRRTELAEHETRYCSPEQLGGEPLDGRSDVYSLGLVVKQGISRDIPIEIERALSHALERYPEDRPTAGELRDALRNALHERGEWVRPAEVARLVSDSASASGSASDSASDRVSASASVSDSVSASVSASVSVSASDSVSASVSASVSVSDRVGALVSVAGALEGCGALYAAIDHLEAAIEAQNLDRLEDVATTLLLYERFGELCLQAHVGDRGAPTMIAGLDLADGVGRDDCFNRLCALLAALLAQADRIDESREWRERAHQVAIARN